MGIFLHYDANGVVTGITKQLHGEPSSKGDDGMQWLELDTMPDLDIVDLKIIEGGIVYDFESTTDAKGNRQLVWENSKPKRGLTERYRVEGTGKRKRVTKNVQQPVI